MRHLAYAGMLVFCLLGTLPLDRWFGLGVLRQARRLSLTLLLAAGPFLVWDLLATHAGHWWFDPAQTLPTRVLGVPWEEVGFFVVIPVAAVLTHAAVGEVVGRRRARRASR
ncbi:lycopene cyclase domain-containing protein [Luteipulveratus sp. YIM 133132]|uniref:lycopene cyclase domain-containing protein n=1 Tax=Luteipulveratus flavus TaxID=3031728 RepID=UPI0023B0B170|nr:lycopene cyclase domain-containing protein [Luteipulveratus sp. YIM 133132]MDE9366771.1 lycopene cyclase domain-containing protein [Luteipulveratus sp. YIM 133132]